MKDMNIIWKTFLYEKTKTNEMEHFYVFYIYMKKCIMDNEIYNIIFMYFYRIYLYLIQDVQY